MRIWKLIAGAPGLALLACASVAAQEAGPTGPIKPAPKREVKRIPIEAPPEAPPVPAEEIIRKFAAKETEWLRARAAARYQQAAKIQEYDENGSPAGDYAVISEVAPSSDGLRRVKVVNETASSLRRSTFSPDELDDLARLASLAFTPDLLGKYELTYAGRQPVDELMTYAFRVQPRKLERRVRYFEGVIWVDDHDFEIVRTFGRFISEVTPPDDVLFKMFEIYRENVDGKFRFPTYLRSDDSIKTKNGEARIRLTIRWSGYQLPQK